MPALRHCPLSISVMPFVWKHRRRCKLSIVKIINRDCSEWSDTPQRPAGYLPAEHRMADGVPPEKVDLYELQRHQK